MIHSGESKHYLPAGPPVARIDVTGYYIAALDGEIGHVEDFLIDDRAWEADPVEQHAGPLAVDVQLWRVARLHRD